MITGIIDSNSILRTGLNTILTNHFPEMQILNAESVEHFYEQDGKQIPDLIFLAEHNNEGLITEVFKLRFGYKQSLIIVYGMSLDVTYLKEYFRRGVVGCISKSSAEIEFINCVKEVSEGRRYVGPDLHELILKEFIETPRANKKLLSTRESEIAIYLSEGRTTSWIASKLDRRLTTISTIKRNIFKKLNISSVIHLRQIIVKH